MPDTLELPWMLRAVIPLVSPRDALVPKIIPDRLPRLSRIVRPLDHLPKPTARLRRIQSVRIGRRSFEMINLPPRKMRPADFPLLPFPIRIQDERPLSRPHQYAYSAHTFQSSCHRPRVHENRFCADSITRNGTPAPPYFRWMPVRKTDSRRDAGAQRILLQ